MAQKPWPAKASTQPVNNPPPPRITGGTAGMNEAKYERTSSVGIVQKPGSNDREAVLLYNRVNANGTRSNTAYHVSTGGTSPTTSNNKPIMKVYDSMPYGTKPVDEVRATPPPVSKPSLTADRSERAAVSASTATTYIEVINPDRLDNPTLRIIDIAKNPNITLGIEERRFQDRIIEDLKKKGYTDTEVQAYLRARDDKERGFVQRVVEARVKDALDRLFGGTSPNNSTGGVPSGSSGSTGGGRGGGGSSGGSGGANGQNPSSGFTPITTPDLQTKLVVRMPNGYVVPDPDMLNSITMPAINQTYRDAMGIVRSHTYVFDYIPSNIQYSELAAEWTEIPRAENYAFVDWSRYKLMRVSMSWIVAADRVESGGTTVHDGLFNSVDSNIMMLRSMAQRKYPVTIVNMDNLLSVKLQVTTEDDQIKSVQGMQFVITDLSVTASRRTANSISGQPTTPSRIAVAQCQMTLQEVPIETVQIASMPQLNIPFTPPKASRASDPITDNSGYPLLSGAFQPVASDKRTADPTNTNIR